MNYSYLSDFVTQLESGGRPKGGGTSSGDIPSLGAEHLTNFGRFNFENLKFIPRDYYEKMNKGIIQSYDILIVKDGATTGKAVIVKESFPYKQAAVNEHLFLLRIDREKYNPTFLFYYLFSGLGKSYILRGFHGSAQGGITRNFVNDVRVPLIDIKTQQKNASILDKCESAKQKRKEANRLTNEFLKSIFIEMFGDPVRNAKRWPIKRFDEVYSSIRYGTGSPPKYQEKGIPFIRATNVKNASIIEREMKYISSEDATKIKKCKLSQGDLIIVRSGVNAGDCALIPPEFDGAYAAYDLIIELPYCNAVFYNHLINSAFGRTMIKPLKRRAGQPHLNAEQIGSLKFFTPPLHEQKKFADLVQKIEKLKEKQRGSEKELDNLFNSLMQKAFRGEM